MSVFTSFAGGRLTAEVPEIGSYSNVTVSVPTAATEVAIVVPLDVMYIALYNESEGTTKLAFTSGESGTNYWPVYPGFREELNKRSGVAMSLYIQCTRSSQTIRIIYGHSA